MKVSWRIGRIFGIDIYIDASWLIIFGLFTWMMSSHYFPGGYPRWPVIFPRKNGQYSSRLSFILHGSMVVNAGMQTITIVKVYICP